jgi:hypothetical protein
MNRRGHSKFEKSSYYKNILKNQKKPTSVFIQLICLDQIYFQEKKAFKKSRIKNNFIIHYLIEKSRFITRFFFRDSSILLAI